VVVVVVVVVIVLDTFSIRCRYLLRSSSWNILSAFVSYFKHFNRLTDGVIVRNVTTRILRFMGVYKC
jgi:hypothetical protein